jgi:SulP family sulfate permease
VSRGLKEEGFEYNLTTLKFFFESPHAIALWGIPLALAIILRIITHRFHHQLIFPAYFFIIPVVFYIVVAIGRWDMATLRENNWVLDVGKQSRPWYTFYTLFGMSDEIIASTPRTTNFASYLQTSSKQTGKRSGRAFPPS